MGGIGIWQLLIILLIVVVLFGTKRLRGIGSDLGGAVKGFRKAMDTDKNKDAEGADSEPQKIQAEQKADADFSQNAKESESSKDKS